MSDAKETAPETVSGEPLDTDPVGRKVTDDEPIRRDKEDQDQDFLIDRKDDSANQGDR
ncbi:MAG TPA: hypothetical protein VGN33_15375 [Leifsonia sp.]|jgi:hypothetical protein|nr:hypothetical protein [Leifsonia sp.]